MLNRIRVVTFYETVVPIQGDMERTTIARIIEREAEKIEDELRFVKVVDANIVWSKSELTSVSGVIVFRLE